MVVFDPLAEIPPFESNELISGVRRQDLDERYFRLTDIAKITYLPTLKLFALRLYPLSTYNVNRLNFQLRVLCRN